MTPPCFAALWKLAIGLWIALPLNAQTFDWGRSGIGPWQDHGKGIAANPAGDVFVTGYMNGACLFDNQVAQTNGGTDGFLAKYDANGSIAWVKNFGSLDNDFMQGVFVDSMGNAFVIGTMTTDAYFDSTWVPNIGLSDVILAKYDPNGNFRWVKHYGGTDYDQCSNAFQYQHNYLYLAGYFWDSASYDNYQFVATQPNYKDGFIMKTDTSGAVQWAIQSSCHQDIFWKDLAVGPAGETYVVARVKGMAHVGPLSDQSQTLWPHLIAKIDAQGQVLWLKQINGRSGSDEVLLSVSPSGDVFLAGRSDDSLVIDGTLYFNGCTEWLARMDSSGNVMWVRGIAYENYMVPIALEADDLDNVYLTGFFRDTVKIGGVILLSKYWVFNTFVAQFAGNGTMVDILQIKGSNSNYPASMFLQGDSTLYLTGGFVDSAHVGSDLLLGHTFYDIYTAQISVSPPVAVRDPLPMPSTQPLQIHPNPAHESITVQHPAITAGCTVTLFQATGNQVYSATLPATQAIISIRHLAPGIYFCRVEGPDQPPITGKFVVQ